MLTRHDAVAALGTIEEAERLWHGAALEEFRHEDWAVPEIARLDELHATLWTRRAETLLDAGRNLTTDEWAHLGPRTTK